MSVTSAQEATTPIRTVDEPQYLLFSPGENVLGGGGPEAWERALLKGAEAIREQVGIGDGVHRQVGFIMLLPVWMMETGLIGGLIQACFRVARQTGLATLLSIESHYMWEARRDLWSKPENVEWMDWKGTPHPNRYMDWGEPRAVAPHMCYNAPEIRAEVRRLGGAVGTVVSQELETLRAQGQEHLFAGVTVTSEAALDNYTALPKDENLWQYMQRTGAPIARLGYNALHNKGYSAQNPPADMSRALAEINQEWLSEWAAAVEAGGVSKSRLYTRVAACAGYPGFVGLDVMNAPLWVAINEHSRPGFTTYALGRLSEDFGPIYDVLAEHGVTKWVGNETNPFQPGRPPIPMYEYMRRHFDHGATLMVMNVGADAELGNILSQAVWSDDALAAYRRFLEGA